MSKPHSDRYTTRAVGTPDSLEYRLYFESNGSTLSIWHDVPLYGDDDKQVLNMVVEIPRWSNAKFEISRNEAFNPIKQDIKDGKARFVRNLFPYKGYIWNYGALPGTWEDPSHVHPDTKHPGDNDPLDALEIGERIAYTGQIKRVKVLGVMALLDEGATDWKIVVIDINDPCASKLNSITDVQQHFPGLLEATREWFKFYKVPDGKKPNTLALNEEFRDQDYAMSIVQECEKAWEKLINGEAFAEEISVVRGDKSHRLLDSGNSLGVDGHQSADENLDKWFFLPK
ncbi:uncharacterized protein Z520_03477 [Fonsecaea multimorphosa CBS 102226]|uniref:Inorganic pyrophosphatase n=1 Tax=Fonsecaea multimorphosa CBS 102226 TaxID=1442371 RepID=A0A0D2HFX8_9EURO|nr:uncharacterized protein Z520_03477 [Fonsecaea multimorphosa CBS 102226]KIY00811.1 hypothetical protein Z520_03477 [Fonsecaea multimorphosa CBS 102226]OAL27910.1 hypothetical protein AYO22_03255 [Fonsecaea multimorphosa]